MTATPDSFRARFLKGELLLGTFIKTPTTHATEILGGVGFDFVVIDEEHAPFDRVTIDMTLLAARASQTAGIVRVADPAPRNCSRLSTMAPPVCSCRMSQRRESQGHGRGVSLSRRQARLLEFAARRGLWEARRLGHVDKSDASVTVIAMIEDPEALEVIDDIVAVEGLDGVFIGRGDPPWRWANGTADPRVRAAMEKSSRRREKHANRSASWSPTRRRGDARARRARLSWHRIRASCGRRRRARAPSFPHCTLYSSFSGLPGATPGHKYRRKS